MAHETTWQMKIHKAKSSSYKEKWFFTFLIPQASFNINSTKWVISLATLQSQLRLTKHSITGVEIEANLGGLKVGKFGIRSLSAIILSVFISYDRPICQYAKCERTRPWHSYKRKTSNADLNTNLPIHTHTLLFLLCCWKSS